MGCCSGAAMWLVPMGVIWWLIASMLLRWTWNYVIVAVTSAKTMEYKHALLLIFTLHFLFAPAHMQNWKGGCSKQEAPEQIQPSN